MKFPYRKFPLTVPTEYFGHSLLRPIIPVTLKTDFGEISYYALIDSGADFNIFHAEIGEAIGLDINAGEEVDFGGIQSQTGAKGYFLMT